MTESYPLKWPIGRDRTLKFNRKPAAFKTTPARSRDELMHQLKLLGARDVVISSNVATYRRGGQEIMYADQSAAKEDPGVAVYYTWKGDQYVLACDKWNTVMDNLQALMKTVDAIRGIERWGTGEMMKAAFAGFKALPDTTLRESEIWQIMGLPSKPASFDGVVTAYKAAAKKAHPDGGGSNEAFQRLQQAYERAKKEYVL